jgi:MYXO-CTERM domain-containing protein
VYGLRRALVLAGAESQMMSLWQVHDDATRALMTAYYRRLQAGEGRSDALREVQLAMAREGLHPFFWAAFIVGGSGRSLSGAEPPAVREAAAPRAVDAMGEMQVRPGCGHGCAVTGANGSGAAAMGMAAAMGALALRMRRRFRREKGATR